MASPTAPAEYPGHVTCVYGPPGTGKTTVLKTYVAELVELNGPDAVRVASFSVTAARHIAEELRKTGGQQLPDRAVGTLHSHAFRALEHPHVALDPNVVSDWNAGVTEEFYLTPSYRGSSNDGVTFSGNPEDAYTGDEKLAALDKLRATLVHQEDWPTNIREFHARYHAWKRDAGAVDFTDMIDHAHTRALDGEAMPGRPPFIIVDEVQDNSPLEFLLLLEWGKHAQHTIFAGDDDQSINGFRGGTPKLLLALRGPDVHSRVLGQSHRVPDAVRRVAERWIRNVSQRKDKDYKPRTDANGKVVEGTAFMVPETLNSSALVDRVQQDTDNGKTVMILASCNYMLEELLTNLRAQGVPFHNPFRPSETRWNPLGNSTDGLSTADRVFRYMKPSAAMGPAAKLWTGRDVQEWMELIKPTGANSGMVRTAKKLAAAFEPDEPVPYDPFVSLFTDETQLARVEEQDVDWLAENLLKARIGPAAYPIQIVRTAGPQALATPPRLVVGTIHSVKGAAADIVYLCSDVSTAAARSLNTSEGSDELTRLLYVGLTRAYESLRLLAPTTPRHISRGQIIPSALEVAA